MNATKLQFSHMTNVLQLVFHVITHDKGL